MGIKQYSTEYYDQLEPISFVFCKPNEKEKKKLYSSNNNFFLISSNKSQKVILAPTWSSFSAVSAVLLDIHVWLSVFIHHKTVTVQSQYYH